MRQDIYLRALRTLPIVEIIFGHFLTNEVSMPLAGCTSNNQKYASVLKTEEKGSDVNLATQLLYDGFKFLLICDKEFIMMHKIKHI